MIGPYTIEVRLGDKGFRRSEPDLVLTFEEMYLTEAVDAVYKFNRSPDATMRGTETLAQFYVALLLEAGEEATLILVGKDRGKRSERSAGYVRRDEHGRAFLTVGTKYSDGRHFVGL
jgi:hypothetical protein